MWTLRKTEKMLVALEQNCSDEIMVLIRLLLFLNLFESPSSWEKACHLEGPSNVLSGKSDRIQRRRALV